jgi:hypothetical protein
MRNTFESYNLAGVGPREVRMTEIEEKLYDVLVERKSEAELGREERINPKDFSCYSEEVIEKDAEYVERMERVFKEQEIKDPERAKERRRGELFEEIIFEGIEEGDWMGGDVEVQKSSRYDDIANKIDGIITFAEEMSSSHMAFGVDVTQSAESVSNKFRKIKKSIQMETLSEVKYFKSENYEGKLLKVPRVIVGVDNAGMKKAAEVVYNFLTRRDYLRAQKAKDPGAKQRFVEAQDAFAKSVFQMVILLEMSIQLHAFAEYCKKTERQREAAIYEKTARKIDVIYNQKKEEKDRSGNPLVDVHVLYEYVAGDKVYQMIKQEVARFGVDGR